MLKFQHYIITMKKYMNCLKNCILFQKMNEQQIESLLKCFGVEIKKYKKNQMIMDEDCSVHHIGIVLTGMVQLEQNDIYGTRNIVGIIEPKELFLESFACAHIERLGMRLCALEECEIMFVEYHKLMHPCCKGCMMHHQIIDNMIELLAMKNIHFHNKLQILSKRTTKEKLLAYLNMQVKIQGSKTITIPFDRQQLADYLGVERSGLSMEISKLKKANIIDCYKNQFKIIEDD